MTVRLEELLAASTPGPWGYHRIEDDGYGEPSEDVRGGNGGIVAMAERCYEPMTETANLHLIALVPDAVRLLIDMEPDLRKLAICQIGGNMEGDPACCAGCHLASLLPRLDRLGDTA